MGQEKEKEKAVRTFTVGDRVFAKVKGYPPWPAYVVNEEKVAKNKVKYHVIFYYTNENALCKPEDMYPYDLYKDKYGKPTKKPYFNRALELIESDVPHFAKYSLAEKMSAVQADVEEIQKHTRKRALEEEANSDSSKDNKRRRGVSESSEHSVRTNSQKQKAPKKPDNMDSPDKGNNKEADVLDEPGDSSPDKKKENMKSSKKRKMSKPMKNTFRPKTAFGENPAIHFEKAKTFGRVNDRETTKGKNEKSTGQVQQKKTAPKGGKRETNKERQENQPKGRKQKVNKENEQNEDNALPDNDPGIGNNSSAKGSSRLRGRKRRTREQHDFTSFERGDQVFAKVRGYPPWPAVVTALANETGKKKKYHVTFYASDQRGVCSAEHIFPYELYKSQYGSPHKKNFAFNMALGLIRKAAGANASNGTGTKNRSAKHQKNEPSNGDLSDNDSPLGDEHNDESTEEEPPDDKLDREKSEDTDDDAEDK
ncbi:PC4 and SFRS1-interacting protein-like [Schistocerca piceifrons]|uniref:PC4 and SFRS1-interacting protein-like n=1 Tax=Schistocerca piceifrons TaxID=274613 RepID=UPI001F5F7BF2|nr:PC4 and SFRS1-interacting protein-like [Schistocerca piceifrons]